MGVIDRKIKIRYSVCKTSKTVDESKQFVDKTIYILYRLLNVLKDTHPEYLVSFRNVRTEFLRFILKKYIKTTCSQHSRHSRHSRQKKFVSPEISDAIRIIINTLFKEDKDLKFHHENLKYATNVLKIPKRNPSDEFEELTLSFGQVSIVEGKRKRIGGK